VCPSSFVPVSLPSFVAAADVAGKQLKL